jgi:hypothetical protein
MPQSSCDFVKSKQVDQDLCAGDAIVVDWGAGSAALYHLAKQGQEAVRSQHHSLLGIKHVTLIASDSQKNPVSTVRRLFHRSTAVAPSHVSRHGHVVLLSTSGHTILKHDVMRVTQENFAAGSE